MHNNNDIIACQVKIFWENNLIHLSKVTNGQIFKVGETSNCQFALPTSQLGIDEIVLVSYLSNIITVNNLIEEKVLSLNDTLTIKLMDFNIEISVINLTKEKRPFMIDKIALSFVGLSLFCHLAFLFSMAFYKSNLNMDDQEENLREQQVLMSQYLKAIAEKEQKEDVEDNKSSGGEVGTRAKGSEGALGTSSPATNKRYGVAGPKNNPDPHLSRQVALKEASEFGIIGLLNAGIGGDPNAPTSPWGRETSSGADSLSGNGNMWGDEIGDNHGINGLGLSGVGEGGDGPGENIGLNKIGGLGNSIVPGFGPTKSLAGKHTAKNIVMRSGTTIASGRIPPEVIQRIIRQSFGRFRSCYELGLRNNPNLSGRVGVRFVISREGAVSQTSNGGSDLPDSEVVNCVVRSFRGLSFPETEGRIVTVTYSIQFSPG